MGSSTLPGMILPFRRSSFVLWGGFHIWSPHRRGVPKKGMLGGSWGGLWGQQRTVYGFIQHPSIFLWIHKPSGLSLSANTAQQKGLGSPLDTIALLICCSSRPAAQAERDCVCFQAIYPLVNKHPISYSVLWLAAHLRRESIRVQSTVYNYGYDNPRSRLVPAIIFWRGWKLKYFSGRHMWKPHNFLVGCTQTCLLHGGELRALNHADERLEDGHHSRANLGIG